jgi:geranylgeranyl reductase family protein
MTTTAPPTGSAPDQNWDAVVIGAGPAGASFAAYAATGGARVLLLERAELGRDKSCGDGLTPRAVAELHRLGVDLPHMHHIDGLRIVRRQHTREVLWPTRAGFSGIGGTLRRSILDAAVLRTAVERGAILRERCPVDSVLFEDEHVCGVRLADGSTVRTPFAVIASGAGSPVAASVGAVRSRTMLQGLAIRAYASSENSADRYLEASIAVSSRGALPGYGWVFPMGDGSVNIGYGILTRSGPGGVNLRHELGAYHAQVRERWGLGEFEHDWAWRLPMSVEKRHGNGWVALGDAAGLVNPCNGEGIDYALESGRIAAEEFLRGTSPYETANHYDARLATELDWFLHAARRFAQTIRSPLLLDTMLRGAMLSDLTMQMTAAVLGNLLDPEGRGILERTVRITDRALRALTERST